jgi:signal transduction histidine kinase
MTCFFFFLKGLRDQEYLYFWIFISLYGIIFCFNSLSFYNTGFKTPFIQQMINTIAVLLPANIFLLMINVYREHISTYVKAVLFSYLFIALMFTLFPFFTVKQYFYILWKIFFVFTAVHLLLYAVKAYTRKFYESAPTLLGISGLIIGFVLESVGGLDFLQITGFFLWDYSTVFFMVCVMYALAARYTRITDLQSASIRVFKAHEDERKRLARELHDGIGTSLLAIKLKIQMLDAETRNGMRVGGEEFPELISEMSNAIDELRDIVMDLRPSFLENIDLSDAFIWHAQRVEERSGIPVRLSIERVVLTNMNIKETLYRIYQEALSNAIKHSGAAWIDVTLRRDGKLLHLEIKDNGKGFEPGNRDRNKTGIGLDTIKERVELVGGILNISSSGKGGTSLFIEVPVE